MSSSLNIAFYVHTICPIGGIETWLYHVSSDLSKHCKVTVFYEKSDPAQLRRLLDAGVNAVHFAGTPKETFDVLVKGYNGSPEIKAKRYVHTLHACFSEMPEYKFEPWKKTTHYLAVSDRAKESFLELFPDTKQPIDVVRNYVPPLETGTTKKFTGTIKMVMASRLSSEKGLKSVIEMVNRLDDMRVDYSIDLFTVFPKIPHLTNGKVKFVQPRLDINFNEYHYLIQLSDSESYCYAVHEALAAGTAVLTKDLPVFKGIVKHGYNGYIYPDISNITNVPVRFEYTPTGSVKKWLTYLNKVLE